MHVRSNIGRASGARVAWVLAAAALVASACVEKADNAVAARYMMLNSDGLPGFRATVYPYVLQHCADCHGRAQQPLFATGNTNESYRAAVPLVNFLEIRESRIVRKSRDGHCGGECSTDGEEMMDLVSKWKQAFDSRDLGNNVPKGNIFTPRFTVPAGKPGGCNLPGGLADINGACWTKVRFSARDFTDAQGRPVMPPSLHRAWFEFDFAYNAEQTDSGPASYTVRNPRVVSVDAPIYVFDIKFFLNGEYRSDYGAGYRSIDQSIAKTDIFGGTGCNGWPFNQSGWFNPNSIPNDCKPQSPYLTPASIPSIIQVRNGDNLDRDGNPLPGEGYDQISFSFEYFREDLVRDCANQSFWQMYVYGPIERGAVACLNCHTSTAPSEAGKRFNMDFNDVINGATEAERRRNICRKFLQRTNFSLPHTSPIIVQPRQGLNGMPPQPNFDVFMPKWLEWINLEADAAGN